jgi:hypothetical protein
MKLLTIHQRIFVIFRRRRMKAFYSMFKPTPSTRLLDIGGAPNTWISESHSQSTFPVTMVNLRFPDPACVTDHRFTVVEADAASLPMPDRSFDIAFSNSVIEHMITWEQQKAFASEARRVAASVWIQTPARSFPLEPHVLAPFFQYLPRKLQLRLARHFTLWGVLTKPDALRIEEMLSDIRLLTYREMQQLFPDCLILKERVLGLTKSYIAVRGFDQ